jgi:hypothetical protein
LEKKSAASQTRCSKGPERRLRELPLDFERTENAGKRHGLSILGSGNPALDAICVCDAPRWEITEKRPRSISGVELLGNRLLRSIYLDETGISENDQLALVAGVIINDDEQFSSVESAIQDLVKQYIPEEHQNGFCFHAKELFFGTGPVFKDRDKYPPERRFEALRAVLELPRALQLPVSMGYVWKDQAQAPSEYNARARSAFYHGFANFMCVIAAEKYMIDICGPKDLARLVAELNADNQKVLEMAHEILRGRGDQTNIQNITGQLEYVRPYLPVRRIKDGISFMKKRDAPILQIADACAFILRVWLEKKSSEQITQLLQAFFGDNKFPDPPDLPSLFYTWTYMEKVT